MVCKMYFYSEFPNTVFRKSCGEEEEAEVGGKGAQGLQAFPFMYTPVNDEYTKPRFKKLKSLTKEKTPRKNNRPLFHKNIPITVQELATDHFIL